MLVSSKEANAVLTFKNYIIDRLIKLLSFLSVTASIVFLLKALA